MKPMLMCHREILPKRKTNVEAATAILNENYSEMTENLSTRNAHAAVIAALCICAEQTFSDGFAERGTFAHAFERAFITYISSASKSEVESAIKALALQDDEADEGDEDDDEDDEGDEDEDEDEDDEDSKDEEGDEDSEDDQDGEKSRLIHIIKKYRLRIPQETA
ncbi:hypothetical protein B0H11DRAFT_2029010 [Mycena galericulata]|nr:hypothetical protein B0H11DRAFT_2029010 [Mycena galericulata]